MADATAPQTTPEGDEYDEGEPLTATGKPYKRPTIVACIGCRGIKVKCRLPNGEAPTGFWGADQSKCTRCIRLQLDCVYKTAPRRGRRPKERQPSTGGQADAESSETSRAMALDQPDAFSGNAVASTSSALHAPHAPHGQLAPHSGVATSSAGAGYPPAGLVPAVQVSLPIPGGTADAYTPGFFNALFPAVTRPSAAPSVLQPPTWPAPSRSTVAVPPAPMTSAGPSAAVPPAPHSTLSQSSPALSSGMHASPASQASASLDANPGLSLAEAAQARSSAFRSSQPEESQPAQIHRPGRLPDPVDLWILSEAEARALIDQWHEQLNCYVILLDRHLHTFAYVRTNSPVLFTAMLATAAKFFRHDLYPRLLAHAQNMVTRAMGGDIEPNIGVLQAVLLLVYWKEPLDASAWLRIGYAIRLGYQLRLYRKRIEPLPADELEARILLDRERTWIVLICFDNTYELHTDDGEVETRMITTYNVDIDAWLTETLPYDVRDDAEQGVSMGLIQVSRLCRVAATASSKSAAQSVAQHAHEIILTTHRKYFEGSLLPGLTPLRGPASHKARFHVVATRLDLAQACLKASGVQDQLVLADAILRAGELVDCFDDAASSILLYVQDTIALHMLGFGEWIGRLFPHVSNAHQTTFVRYLTQVYIAATRAQRVHRAEAGGYIARFFRGALRAIRPESMPLTRPPSPRGGLGQTDNNPLRRVASPAQTGPFEQLNGMEQEIFTDLDSLFADLKHDTTYWDSLNPTLANSTWAWLDEAFAAPQQGTVNSG